MERQFGRFPKEENKFSKTMSFLKTGCTTNNKLIATTITNHNKQNYKMETQTVIFPTTNKTYRGLCLFGVLGIVVEENSDGGECIPSKEFSAPMILEK